jgi:RNA polymerase-binding transcription factor DksA
MKRRGIATKTAGTGRDLRGFEVLLRRQRAELLDLLAHHRITALEPGGIRSDDPAEVAGELYDHEEALTVKTLLLQRLGEVEEALRRLHDGTYGRCEVCGNPIGRARLEVIPTALRRVKCQERLERGLRRQPVREERPRSKHS